MNDTKHPPITQAHRGGWLAAIEMSIHIVGIIVGVLHFFPALVPEAVIVYRIGNETVPGSGRFRTSFENPGSQPLSDFVAAWRVDRPDVRLLAGADAPKHDKLEPDPLSREFRAKEDIPSMKKFSTILDAADSFDVVETSFAATTPKVVSTGVLRSPVEVLEGSIYDDRTTARTLRLVLVAVGIAAWILLVRFLARMVRRIGPHDVKAGE